MHVDALPLRRKRHLEVQHPALPAQRRSRRTQRSPLSEGLLSPLSNPALGNGPVQGTQAMSSGQLTG